MATLRDLAARIAAVTPAQAVEAAAVEIQAAAVADVQGRMLAGLQPDGSPQPPLKHPRKSGTTTPPLVDQGRLLASATAVVEGVTLTVSASGPGAQRHQRTRPFVGLSAGGKLTLGKLVILGYLRKIRGG